MEVAIAGGHGKVALNLSGLLTARGDRVRGIIRNPDHAAEVAAAGAEPVLLDLEDTTVARLADAIRGADAVVFSAGAGSGSGAERKWTIDYGGAVALIEAARLASVERYLMVSAMGATNPPDGEDVFSIYLQAKAKADQELMASGLAWTIVRPGGLTDDPPTGLVNLGPEVPRGSVPRSDVAAVLVAALDETRTAGHTFEVTSGDTPIEKAITQLLS
jgi:uncharacterized protein YbjT (DUF2867 family)